MVNLRESKAVRSNGTVAIVTSLVVVTKSMIVVKICVCHDS